MIKGAHYALFLLHNRRNLVSGIQSSLLLDQAKLYEGETLADTSGFIARLNRIMAKAL